ncbi:hypothetical protein HF521_017014 [Silurus meridionalis]|uniref:Uncharacterized protein n=1 Tax=Silurus meridionalis TaxID=175797 RepID=A0A8T0BQW3_SILME|nr:hypothetical protein HF521_017014 [Silurus meridionalis]
MTTAKQTNSSKKQQRLAATKNIYNFSSIEHFFIQVPGTWQLVNIGGLCKVCVCIKARAYMEACAEGYSFIFDTFRPTCDACFFLLLQKHCLWCLEQPTCPLGERCYNFFRKWIRFPPEKDEFVWKTDADPFRPVMDILHHADMFSPDGMWLDSIQNSVYDLTAGLQLITRILHVRGLLPLSNRLEFLPLNGCSENSRISLHGLRHAKHLCNVLHHHLLWLCSMDN